MKKIISILLILSVGITGFFFYYHYNQFSGKLKQYNLTKPQKRVVEIDGEKYHIVVYKYEPPYQSLTSETQLLKNSEEADYSMPEGTNLALWSAVGRNKEWYASLFDENARKKLLQEDEENGGRILEEYSKSEPLIPPEGSYEELLYKVEIEFNGKKYAIIQMKNVVKGKEFPGHTYRSFVKEKVAWLATDDLKNHQVKSLVGLKSYDEFLKLSKKDRTEKAWKLIVAIGVFVLVILLLKQGLKSKRG